MALLVPVCLAAACEATSPTAPGHGHLGLAAVVSSGPFATAGQVFDGVSQSGIGGVVIRGDGLLAFSDAGGFFTLAGPSGSAETRTLTFTGSTVVERQTHLKLPGANVQVSLIPTSFDLASFNQMFRSPQLRRWRQPPPVVIETRALQFTDVNASASVGTTDAMTDQEFAGLSADLAWALPQLSGNTFPAFAAMVKQASAQGALVPLLNTGQITVARVVGLTTATGFWGYGRWQTQSDGTVVAGNLVLDRDFERSGSQFLRSLRTHELGHAMGYDHVTGRASFMNSNARLEPNEFDQSACRIAFARQPGNRAPDTDLSTASLNRLSPALTWGPPIR